MCTTNHGQACKSTHVERKLNAPVGLYLATYICTIGSCSLKTNFLPSGVVHVVFGAPAAVVKNHVGRRTQGIENQHAGNVNNEIAAGIQPERDEKSTRAGQVRGGGEWDENSPSHQEHGRCRSFCGESMLRNPASKSTEFNSRMARRRHASTGRQLSALMRVETRGGHQTRT